MKKEITLYSPESFWVSKCLFKYLDVDEFGMYKRPGVKIPWIYKKEYERCKKAREKSIENMFRLELSDSSDKIKKEKLLRMG